MIDCHLHLQDPRLGPSLPSVMETLRHLGVRRLVVNGTRPKDWDAVETLAKEHPEVVPSFGLHPWYVAEAEGAWLDELEERLLRFPEAGVGEIGLDRWKPGLDFARQREVFLAQLDLAHRLDRPLSLHCLQAWGSLFDCLDNALTGPGFLLHSYGGPREMVGAFVEKGAFISISGYFFRPGKEAKLATFDAVPEDRLLLETDAPDMLPPLELVSHALPDPLSNHPANLAAIYGAVAGRLGLSRSDLEKIVSQNFVRWFGRGRSLT